MEDRTAGVRGAALWAEERGQVRDRGRAEEELAWGRVARRRWPMAGRAPERRCGGMGPTSGGRRYDWIR